jgi:restriction system protein
VAATRKAREKQRNDAINLVYGLSLLGGIWVGLRTHSYVAGLAVVGIMVLATALVLSVLSRRRMTRLLASGIGEIDTSSGERFEEILVALFRARGYRAKLTPNGADFGADLVLDRNGHSTVVQAKRWKKDVGIAAVQEVVAAKAHYGAECAMVITNAHFTQAAVTLANSNGVDLWDRDRLAKELPKRAPSQASASAQEPVREPPPVAAPDEPTGTLSCPRCGTAMVARTSAHGPFWGCSAFPRCRGTLPRD